MFFYSFYIVLQYCLFRFFPPGVGSFLTLLIDLSFPPLGNLIKKFENLSNPPPLPALPPPPPNGVYIDRCISSLFVFIIIFRNLAEVDKMSLIQLPQREVDKKRPVISTNSRYKFKILFKTAPGTF